MLLTLNYVNNMLIWRKIFYGYLNVPLNVFNIRYKMKQITGVGGGIYNFDKIVKSFLFLNIWVYCIFFTSRILSKLWRSIYGNVNGRNILMT